MFFLSKGKGGNKRCFSFPKEREEIKDVFPSQREEGGLKE